MNPDLSRNSVAGYRFSDTALLRRALTHPSAQRVVEGGTAIDSERLEYLGDAVLGLVVAEALYAAHPGEPEGVLTRRRAALVSRAALARLAREAGLPALIDAGDDPASAERIRKTDSAAANALEAVIGAVHLDGGFAAARGFALRLLGDPDREAPEVSPRNRLQELLQSRDGGANVAALLEYRTVAATGPAHARRYVVEVWFDGALRGTGEGSSVRAASESAARAALAARE